MFRVEADTLAEYFAVDPARTADLKKFDALIRKAAPGLKRYFHRGTPAGEPGMRFKMIGYGRSSYRAASGLRVEWPVAGVALQKNYISAYFTVCKNGGPLTSAYEGRLGEARMGRNNFSFERFDDLWKVAVAALFAEAAEIYAADPMIVDRIKSAERAPRPGKRGWD